MKTAEKSNEITAIPELLDALLLKGCTVTIDAVGCQTAIVAKIIEKECDYVLPVKNNQPTLAQAIEGFFNGAREKQWEGVPHTSPGVTRRMSCTLPTGRSWNSRS